MLIRAKPKVAWRLTASLPLPALHIPIQAQLNLSVKLGWDRHPHEVPSGPGFYCFTLGSWTFFRCVGQREGTKDDGEFAKAAEYQGWMKKDARERWGITSVRCQPLGTGSAQDEWKLCLSCEKGGWDPGTYPQIHRCSLQWPKDSHPCIAELSLAAWMSQSLLQHMLFFRGIAVISLSTTINL